MTVSEILNVTLIISTLILASVGYSLGKDYIKTKALSQKIDVWDALWSNIIITEGVKERLQQELTNTLLNVVTKETHPSTNPTVSNVVDTYVGSREYDIYKKLILKATSIEELFDYKTLLNQSNRLDIKEKQELTKAIESLISEVGEQIEQ